MKLESSEQTMVVASRRLAEGEHLIARKTNEMMTLRTMDERLKGGDFLLLLRTCCAHALSRPSFLVVDEGHSGLCR